MRVLRYGFPLLALLLAAGGSANAAGLLIPEDKKLPPLAMVNHKVTVTVEAGPGPYPCPECLEPVPGYDRKRRQWRHLDTCQFTRGSRQISPA